MAAATLRLPLVDADGMGGRSPSWSRRRSTCTAARSSPVVVADEGAVLVIDGVDGLVAERLTRAAVVTLGGWGLIALARSVPAPSRRRRSAATSRALVVLPARCEREPGRDARRYGDRTLLRADRRGGTVGGAAVRHGQRRLESLDGDGPAAGFQVRACCCWRTAGPGHRPGPDLPPGPGTGPVALPRRSVRARGGRPPHRARPVADPARAGNWSGHGPSAGTSTRHPLDRR
ncbi:DUF917 family protein [Pseudonocardia sp. MCCB 268]|nr:DUF917 family protein [Pseudonocardia cytotoxica]